MRIYDRALHAQLIMLCCGKNGGWRPDALGYILSKLRERAGAVYDLKVETCGEIVALLIVAREISLQHKLDERAGYVVRTAAEYADHLSHAAQDGRRDVRAREQLKEAAASFRIQIGAIENARGA